MIVLQDDDGACLGVSKANLILRDPAVWSYYYTMMISLRKIIAMVTIIIVIFCVFLSTRLCNRSCVVEVHSRNDRWLHYDSQKG